ncbi:MAG: ATP-binding protein [Bacilli bacterium]
MVFIDSVIIINDLNYITNEREGLYFDRKSSKIAPKDLANSIASFANANGGILVVGLNDEGIIEGFNGVGIDKLNELQKATSTYLKITPRYRVEILDVINNKSIEDNVLVFHIEPAPSNIIKNVKDEVFIRQGDSSIKLDSTQIRSLEYDKKERDFETEIISRSSLDDLDYEMLALYKDKLNTDLSYEEILEARDFVREYEGKKVLTKAGILCFGKNPSKYLPSARVRVLKFEGTEFGIGSNYNIVKDKTFDFCLYKTIEKAKEFIDTQLRDFTYLSSDGIFETIPEFPEFAWFEGLVNAVTHRDYSNSGEHITVKLYDDRMEIHNPGKLGGFVTIDTMMNKRYSRNPKISRVLVELGIVRELNEGVKRIYKEMKDFFLEEPHYSEPHMSSVLLVLKNNIMTRSSRKNASLLKMSTIKKHWDNLTPVEQLIVQAAYDKGEVSMKELLEITERSKPTILKMIENLKSKSIIDWYGTNLNDPHGKYIIKENKSTVK